MFISPLDGPVDRDVDEVRFEEMVAAVLDEAAARWRVRAVTGVAVTGGTGDTPLLAEVAGDERGAPNVDPMERFMRHVTPEILTRRSASCGCDDRREMAAMRSFMVRISVALMKNCNVLVVRRPPARLLAIL